MELTPTLIHKTSGPLALAVFELSNVQTNDTVELAPHFQHVKNATFFPVTINVWEEGMVQNLTHDPASLTRVVISNPSLDHESGWLVVVGGA